MNLISSLFFIQLSQNLVSLFIIIYIMCVCDVDLCIIYLFCYNIICVNCDVCECVRVYYEYNITLYNLIIRKYREFVTYVCIVVML